MQLNLITIVNFSFLFAFSTAATWCGKAYQQGDPATPPPPSSHFPIPARSPKPLLDFRCAQAEVPYVEGEKDGCLIVTLEVGWQRGVLWEEGAETWTVQVGGDGKELLRVIMRAGESRRVSFGLDLLVPRASAFVMTCSATSGATKLKVETPFRYLTTNPTKGTTVKLAASGTILVPSIHTPNNWEPFFPHGFYVKFGGEDGLENNLDLLDNLKKDGVNIVHPVPPFDDPLALTRALDRMDELGLYLMYDMRHTYLNKTAVEEEVRLLKNRSNLLLWYTSDEPDGFGDPLNATRETYDLINQLDGHHPISLVLNCADFEWSSYVAGADIVLTDPYPLYVNTSYSSRYGTVCNENYGCCGCDNCHGNLSDISSRLDDSRRRIALSGRQANLTTWTVLQGFGSSEFWTDTPNEQQFLAMAVLAINHGTTGLVSWLAPTTPEIMAATSRLSIALPAITPFLLSHSAIQSPPDTTSTAIDASLWSGERASLLMVVNVSEENVACEVVLPNKFRVSKVILDQKEPKVEIEGSRLSLTLPPFGVWAAELERLEDAGALKGQEETTVASNWEALSAAGHEAQLPLWRNIE